jgi:hypothetical protein
MGNLWNRSLADKPEPKKAALAGQPFSEKEKKMKKLIGD